MNVSAQINQIEDDLAKAGVAIGDFCREAKVNRASWTRWKSGKMSPLLGTWERVLNARDAMVQP